MKLKGKSLSDDVGWVKVVFECFLKCAIFHAKAVTKNPHTFSYITTV